MDFQARTATTMMWVRLVAVLMLVACGASSSGGATSTCGTSLDVKLNDPNDLRHRPEAAWVEARVIAGGCPSEEALKVGQILGSPWSIVPATAAGPAVGDLPTGKTGLAIFVRANDCAVMGYGCTDADVGVTLHVTINVQPNANADHQLMPLGACMAPLACTAGACSTGGGSTGGSTSGGASSTCPPTPFVWKP